LPSSNKRFVHLEALRGLAALIVVVHHCLLAFSPSADGRNIINDRTFIGTPAFFLVNGTGAVLFFFVLSGFVLPLAVIGSGKLSTFLRSALKRLPRLYLPVGISMLCGWLILTYLPHQFVAIGALTKSPWLSDFGSSGLLGKVPTLASAIHHTIAVFFGGSFGLNSSLWTMTPELAGSGVALVAGLVWAKTGKILAGVIFVVLAIASFRFDEILLPFVMGAALSAIMGWRALQLPPWGAACCIVLGLTMLSFLEPVGAYHWVPTSDYVLINSVGAAMLILGVHSRQGLRDALGGGFGQWLGKYSFPIYLMQVCAITVVGSAVFSAANGVGWPSPLVAAAAIGAAALSTFILATPLMLLDLQWTAFLNKLFRRRTTLPLSETKSATISG